MGELQTFNMHGYLQNLISSQIIYNEGWGQVIAGYPEFGLLIESCSLIRQGSSTVRLDGTITGLGITVYVIHFLSKLNLT